ncbi:hypothetical protein I4U23_003499 [Adineta vaga]|nr:hypothetical protein I4U23_003499 [Adineta vaga]
MRSYQVGPGSSKSTWKATLDPGKSLPCSNSGHQPTSENDTKPSTNSETNGQGSQQSSNNQQKK